MRYLNVCAVGVVLLVSMMFTTPARSYDDIWYALSNDGCKSMQEVNNILHTNFKNPEDFIDYYIEKGVISSVDRKLSPRWGRPQIFVIAVSPSGRIRRLDFFPSIDECTSAWSGAPVMVPESMLPNPMAP